MMSPKLGQKNHYMVCFFETKDYTGDECQVLENLNNIDEPILIKNIMNHMIP